MLRASSWKAGTCRWLGAALLLPVLLTSVWSDSIQLRDGSHYHGKYMGGSEEYVMFMSSGTLQYFPVASVIAVGFDKDAEFSLQRFNARAQRPQRPQLKRVSAPAPVQKRGL